MNDKDDKLTRRDFVRAGARGACILGVGAVGASMAPRAAGSPERMLWQIDPGKCIACGNCATHCVLKPSAVKCAHDFTKCGRCNFCFGHYETSPGSLAHAGVEYQQCPTDAIVRKYLGGPYYEYTIDEDKCIACGLCVKGCKRFGNSSLYLQVNHDRCLHCNECAIAAACPSEAFIRVPADAPYPLKDKEHGS